MIDELGSEIDLFFLEYAVLEEGIVEVSEAVSAGLHECVFVVFTVFLIISESKALHAHLAHCFLEAYFEEEGVVAFEVIVQQLFTLRFGQILQHLHVQLQLFLVNRAHVLVDLELRQHIQDFQCETNKTVVLCDFKRDVYENFSLEFVFDEFGV